MGNLCQRRQNYETILPQDSPFLQKTFEQWCIETNFDTEVGLLVDIDKYRLPKKYDIWYEKVYKLGEINNKEKTREFLSDLPLLTTDELTDYHDVLVAYSLTIQMSTSYIWNGDKPVQSLPKELAIPLYDTAQKLKINPVYSHLSQMINWTKIDQTKDYAFDNIKLRYSFTDSIDEDNFFVASHWPTVLYARLFRLLWNIQYKINDHDVKGYIQDMEQIRDIINEIAKTVKKIWEKTRPFMFFSVYGKYLTGFTDKKDFPEGVYFEGVDKYISVPGGSAGQDNGFQVFERAMGLNYRGLIGHMQEHIQQGITFPWKYQIKFMQDHSKIRSFAEYHKGKAKDIYNQVLDKWALFWQRHHAIIKTYVEDEGKKNGIKPSELKSTGDVALPVIKKKYDEVLKYYIK